jgi:DNA-binding transcriptional ArsR family regulator
MERSSATLAADGLTPEDIDDFVTHAREASEFLKALAHETRLMILCLLSEGEKSVGELEAKVKQPQAIVSQQLARLRLDDIVRTRREGRQIYYSIARAEIVTVVKALYVMFCADDVKGV